MYLALNYFVKATSRHIPPPKIEVYSDGLDFRSGYFDPNDPSKIFLNSAHSKFRNPVVHELVHYSRYHLLGNRYPLSLEAQSSTLRVEEACASFGDAAFHAREDKDTKGKIIIGLNSMYYRGSNKVDIFDTALAVLDYYKNWKIKKETIESIVEGTGSHKPYVIDAGFALVMLVANGLDEKNLLKKTLTLSALDLWRDTDAVLVSGHEGIKKKIEMLRSKYK